MSGLLELFDIVDATDRVVGQKTRSWVHRHGLRHRAVHTLLFNAREEIFLQKRSPSKDLNPGVWDSSCSGHLHAGETYDEAARRELGEELGLTDPIPLRPVCKLAAQPETGNEFIWVYLGESDGPFCLDPEEISEGRFLRISDLQREIRVSPDHFSPVFVHLWSRLRHQFLLRDAR
ncbi:MAG: NUDIX domain-containing protein [Methylacidiphilaceae bacterium]|nr:NUDIX domain-containing protein [Candidatus Methylacidiphilaceae bacterium]